MNEISNLMAQKKKFENPKFRLVTSSFESCNGEGAIEAKDSCVDFFIGAFDLFMENSKEAGTVIYPAVSVKKPGCKTFKTIIDKPKVEKVEYRPKVKEGESALEEIDENHLNSSVIEGCTCGCYNKERYDENEANYAKSKEK